MSAIILPGKTIDRGRRCQNCRHFVYGEAVVTALKRKLGIVGDIPFGTAPHTQALLNAVKAGTSGSCRFIEDDTVSMMYLCNKWSGISGSSLIGGSDKLPEEELDG